MARENGLRFTDTGPVYLIDAYQPFVRWSGHGRRDRQVGVLESGGSRNHVDQPNSSESHVGILSAYRLSKLHSRQETCCVLHGVFKGAERVRNPCPWVHKFLASPE